MTTPNVPPEATQPNDLGDPGQEGKPVSYETFRELLDQKKKSDQKAKAYDEVAKKNREYEEAEKRRVEQAQIEKGEFEKVLSEREKKIQDLEAEKAQVREREINAKKFSSIVRGLGSPVEERWHGLIAQELEDVSADEHGNIDTATVTKVVNKLKSEFPEMVKKAPVAPNGTPPGNNTVGTIKYSEWKKLSDKEMAKWKRSQIVDG